MTEILESRAAEYARWCIGEQEGKVPRYVKKQAAAWLDIAEGRNPEAFVDEGAYRKICQLLRLMVHPDLGCPLYDGLEDYAWLLITAALCTKRRNGSDANPAGCSVPKTATKIEGPEGEETPGVLRFRDSEIEAEPKKQKAQRHAERDSGRGDTVAATSRLYETVVLEIARKNFKTFNSAVIFILLMLSEPKFSRFFSVAPDLKLSSELKLAIRKIIKCSPALSEDGVFKVLRSEIRCLLTDSDYTPLAYSQDKMDGKLANAFLADEAGAMDAYPIEAMRSSQITLPSKLGIVISTQYPKDSNAMEDEIDISKKTLDGFLDSRRFSLLYEPDPELLAGDQWQTDDRIIYQSNPVAVKNRRVFQAVQDLRTMAVLYENRRENYLCKHNNIKYKGLGAEGYVEISKVQACRGLPEADFWRGKPVYLGLDLSQSDDNTAVAMVTVEDGVLYGAVWGFLPGGRMELKTKRENVDYPQMAKQGCCFACGGEVVDYGAVESFILSLPENYGVKMVSCGYDRYNAISTAQKLEEGGLPCVEVKQHSSVLHSPTKLLKEKILEGKFRYAENPLLEINFQNARCVYDANLNLYVNKKRSAGKVDMVVALINAVYLAQQDLLFGSELDWGAQF